MGNIGYYLGDGGGNIHYFNPAYTADGSTAITSQCISKRLDFLDQYPQLFDREKTVHGAKLTYIDKGAVSVTVSVSADGGTNWSTDTNTVGTAGADGTIKTMDFDFIVPGEYFNVKIYHSATTGVFEWVQLELEIEDMGEHFYKST